MKNITPLIILLFIAFSSYTKAQNENSDKTYYTHYIVLDSLKNTYGDNTINKFTLNSKDLYGIDKKIEVYNVLYKESILLISALPNLAKGKDWIKIDIDSDIVRTKILSKKQLKDFINEREAFNTSDKKTLKYGLIIKKDGGYYVPKTTLVEYFNIGNYASPLISSYGTININENLITIREMEKNYKKQNPDGGFPLDIKNFHSTFNSAIYARNYISKKYTIKDEKAYQFWTLDSWRIFDGYNQYRGIDRFIYIPNKGIVGGSYDFYFYFLQHYISDTTPFLNKLWDNIINEKVMIAEELK